MQGKYQRTEGKTFLGTKYRKFTCTKCKTKYEHFGLGKPKICPPCENETIEEYIEKNMDYSKSFDECFRDQARLTREFNDSHKND